MKKNQIELNLNEYYPKPPKHATKEQLRLGKRAAKSAKKHFKVHGWDLDYGLLMDELVYDLLGFHAEQLFWPYMKGTKLRLESEKRSTLVLKKAKRK